MSPEEMSFRNLVEFHREELTKLMEGTPAKDVFTEYHHKRLVGKGVLRRNPHINRTLPTPEAMMLLQP